LDILTIRSADELGIWYQTTATQKAEDAPFQMLPCMKIEEDRVELMEITNEQTLQHLVSLC
jgi:hypothetical protein